MLHKKTLDEIVHLAIETLENRFTESFEVYRSIDKNNTAQYFSDDKTIESEFEIIIFRYNYSKQHVYIKYPDANFYIEMCGGYGSAHGTIMTYNLRNIIAEKQHPFIYEGVLQAKNEKILKHDDYAVYSFGLSDFNFLKRVANINKQNCNDVEFGRELIDEISNRKFIPLPDEKDIAYSLVTDDNSFIIVDQSAHNFAYETMRCFYGNFKDGIKEGKIINFARYRDGGTTTFSFIINNEEHEFYYPTSFKKELKPTWNKKKVTEIPKETLDIITTQLGINIAPKVKRNND